MAEADAFLPESLPVSRDGVTLHAGLVSERTFTAKFGLDPRIAFSLLDRLLLKGPSHDPIREIQQKIKTGETRS